MTLAWPVVGVALALLWLFVRGVALAPAPIAGEFLIGLGFGLPVAYAARALYPAETNLRRGIAACPYAGVYVAVFLKDLVVANVDVAYRVLAPSMPIEPTVVVFPLRVRTDFAVTTIANSITLTPGTLTMDYDDDRHALVVHTLAGGDPESVKAPIRTWEDYALVIFDEELKPGDPVPSPPDRPSDAPDGSGGDGGGG